MRISDCYRSFHKCGHFLGFKLTFERNRQFLFGLMVVMNSVAIRIARVTRECSQS